MRADLVPDDLRERVAPFCRRLPNGAAGIPRLLWKRGIKPLIARRGVAHGSGLDEVRRVVERAFAWLHQFKRLRAHSG